MNARYTCSVDGCGVEMCAHSVQCRYDCDDRIKSAVEAAMGRMEADRLDLEAARARIAELEEWQRAVAEGFGYLNRAEGQDGYEVAPAATLVTAWREACGDAAAYQDTLEALTECGAWGHDVDGDAVVGVHSLTERIAELERALDDLLPSDEQWAETADAEAADGVDLATQVGVIRKARAALRRPRAALANTKPVPTSDPRDAHIAELETALRGLFDAYCGQMRSEYDYPNSPWSPERDNDEAALAARAALANTKPAPALTPDALAKVRVARNLLRLLKSCACRPGERTCSSHQALALLDEVAP